MLIETTVLELSQQPALANTGLTDNGRGPTCAGSRHGDQFLQRLELRFASHHRAGQANQAPLSLIYPADMGHLVNHHRSRSALQLYRSTVVHFHIGAQKPPGLLRDQDSTGLGQGLQSRRHVHGVA